MINTYKSIVYLGLSIMMMFFSGCEIYDCDAAETEIVTMQTNLTQEPWVDNATYAKCNDYKDKVNEYEDEGCGTSEDTDFDCEEFTCTAMYADYLIYVLNMLFTYDETTYCSYYDSTGMVAQEMVNAGGCASYFDSGTPMTQTFVDTWVSDGCNWGDSTATSSIINPIGDYKPQEIKMQIGDLVQNLPDDYSIVLRKRLNRLSTN